MIANYSSYEDYDPVNTECKNLRILTLIFSPLSIQILIIDTQNC